MSSRGFAPVSYPEVGPTTQAGASSAQARGYAAGYAEGLRRAAAEHRAAEHRREEVLHASLADAAAVTRRSHAALGAAVDVVRALAMPLIEEAEHALVEGAVSLAEAVLQRELADGHITVTDVLRRAVASVPDGELVAVRLNPVDAALVEPGGEPSLTIVADESIAPGDAVAVLRQGWLDARIGAALDRAKAVLLGEQL